MEPTRIGIIGLGNMGSSHVKDCTESPEVQLTAVCDNVPERLAATEAAEEVARFDDAIAMMESGTVEAVIIATPHYDHTPLAIAAFERGIHVLCEKPVGVHVNDVKKMIAAHEAAKTRKPDIKFAAMFQQRSLGHWQKIKEILEAGTLGKLARATWIITDWFRTQYYYDTGSWRATWKGEGGGVLLNQCPHNLDLYQWFFGVPESIHGTAAIGKYHTIEVEDEVTGIFRHANGMVGHFITTTAESPGTNRLEIAGEMGKLVFENGTITLDRNEQSMLTASAEVKKSFMHVPHTLESVEFTEGGGKHRYVIEVFARSIRSGSPLVAEASEGIGSVTLANGILMSHFTGKTVDLPLDGDAYEELLQGLIAKSTFSKGTTVNDEKVDMGSSF